MRTTGLSAITLAALLVLAGCTGGPGTGTTTTPETTTATDAGTTGVPSTSVATTTAGTTPGTTTETVVEQDQTMACTDGGGASPGTSPDAFPAASAIDESVLDRHSEMLMNTNFTFTDEESTKLRSTADPENFTYWNSTERFLIQPGASQYLGQANGTLDTLGASAIQAGYSNGTVWYQLSREDNESTVNRGLVGPGEYNIYNESSDQYLWRSWADHNMYWWATDNVTYERKGVQTFQGVEAMCYKATGLPEPGGFTTFSSTLLIDADGIIRYNRIEMNYSFTDSNQFRHYRHVGIVSDVGSTDVETPDWVPNATAGS